MKSADPSAPVLPGSSRLLLDSYRTPSTRRSVLEIIVTLLPLGALWVLAYLAYAHGYWWLSLVLTIPAAGLLVRMFMIQHDCGHGSFFTNRAANDWIGRAIGVLTMTPYDFWRRTHAVHHATNGNLDRRGMGDIDTLTVREYMVRSWIGRLQYRIYRNPIVLFVIGPAYLFLLQHRLPVGLMRAGWRPWISTQVTNLAIALGAGGLIWLVGWQAFLFVHLPIVVLAASIGVWLFYIQHQFEDTFWSDSKGWNFQEAALRGSSHYQLPAVLRWFTANIGIHHVHHLSSSIPYYRLPKVLRDFPQLQSANTLSMVQSLKCVRLALWDEQRQSLVSFATARRSMAQRQQG